MKKLFILFCTMALIMTACRKPEPGIIPENDEPVVKKYLVKQLLNDDPEKPMLAIEWNDDCTKILHVKYGLGYGSLVDYDFTYFGEDSIRLSMSLPTNSYPLWQLWFDTLMIHLTDNNIDSISCYANGELRRVEHYLYSDEGKLIERKYGGEFDTFEWVGDDVIKCKMYGMSSPITIDTFTKYIYPQYTLPFYLSSEVAFEIRRPLFTPLWKHQPLWNNYDGYEADEDGYLTKMTQDSTLWITYYYTTPNIRKK